MTMVWPEKLWEFQEEDVPFFLEHPMSMILYEPRLGKTVVTCEVLARDPKTGPGVIIACSKNAFSTWLEHLPAAFAKLAPNKTVEVRIIRGTADKRKAEWLRPRKTDIVFYLITFASLINDYPFLSDKKARFDTVIGDEVHRNLKNRKNKSAIIFRDFVKQARRFHPLSGTLAGKWGPGDYWTILNMFDRQKFSTWWGWVNRYCIIENNGFGMQMVGVKNVDELHRVMNQYARLRKRGDVRPDMPKVVRSPFWVEPSKAQRKLYDALAEEKVIVTDSGQYIVVANSLEESIRRRQLLACPEMIVPGAGVGEAFAQLVDMIEDAKAEGDIYGHHIVVYSAFRRALPYWEAFLRERGHTDVWQLYGGLEPEDLQERIAGFKKSMGIILCSTKFAQAFSLASARTCYHIGMEHDPNDNIQADGRLVPPNGDHSINSYYFGYLGTQDEELVERIGIKQQIITVTTTMPVDTPRVMFDFNK